MVSLTHDGPAARGGPAGRPAGPGRRPRPAGLGRGRRGARRSGPGRRAAPEPALDAALADRWGCRPGCATVWSRSTTCGGSAARSPSSPAPCRPATPTPRSRCSRAGHPDVELVATGRIAAVRRDVVAAGRELDRAAAGRRRGRGAGRAGAAPGAVRAPPRPVRRGPSGPPRSSAGCAPPLPAAGRDVVPRAAAAGHGERLRHRAVQRRHRRGRGHRPEGPRVAFARGGPPTLIPPARLSDVVTVHAMTVHRGQGSQFRRVTVVLPQAESPLLTRELLYTAVTRAREHVRVVGSRGRGAGRGRPPGRAGRAACGTGSPSRPRRPSDHPPPPRCPG